LAKIDASSADYINHSGFFSLPLQIASKQSHPKKAMGEVKHSSAHEKNRSGGRNSSSSPTSIAAILNAVAIENRVKTNPVFASLHRDSTLLFLTPYLHLPPPIGPRHEQVDPFEPFGRRLMKYHRHVKHIPYVAKTGIHWSHEECIREAGGVLVVVCDSSASEDFDGERLDRVKDQERAAMQLMDLSMSLGKPTKVLVIQVDRVCKSYCGSRSDIKSWELLKSSIERVFLE
jgi:hypothetical protein